MTAGDLVALLTYVKTGNVGQLLNDCGNVADDSSASAPLAEAAVPDADPTTPLSDAQPFEYSDESPVGDTDELAGIPFNGAPNSWASSMPGTMPQLRQYVPGGTPMTDIDFESHHGNPNPHAHNWNGTSRDEGAPVSILPW